MTQKSLFQGKFMADLTQELNRMLEQWKPVDGYSKYQVSNLGRIWNNDTESPMALSRTQDGYMKVSLVCDEDGARHTCSVAPIVAEAFVCVPELTDHHTSICDHVVILDGNQTNLRVDNLRWRPRWFAFQYRAQLNRAHPLHYTNLRVLSVPNELEYDSIVLAGVSLGLLFSDIWRSTHTGDMIFPTWEWFEVVGGNYDN